MEDKKKLTEDIAFELGKVKIGGDAIKVEEPPKEEDKKEKKSEKNKDKKEKDLELKKGGYVKKKKKGYTKKQRKRKHYRASGFVKMKKKNKYIT